jgi:hypothetical protein
MESCQSIVWVQLAKLLIFIGGGDFKNFSEGVSRNQ